MMRDPDRDHASLLPSISVKRPVTVLMLLSALVLIGIVALSRLPVQMMPGGFDPPFMMVFVPFPAANPAEVEEKIVRPLEDALYTVRGIQEVNCRASSDSGRCWVQFMQSVEMDEVYQEVADRVERLKATDWPEEVDRVRLRRFNPTDDAPLKVGIKLAPSIDDPYWLLTHRVVQPLERVPGVAQVDLEGVQEKEIFIEPDRDALEAHRLSLFNLYQSLRRANFALSSGTIREAGGRLFVRSVARFRAVEEFARIPVRADGLRLGDVARIRYDFPPPTRGARLDGRPAAMLEVFKESEANTREVTSAAIAELQRIFEGDAELARAASFDVLFDQGEVIEDSIRQLRDTGLIGGLFAVVVLYLFLRRLRVTLLITTAIPASLLAALVVMFLAGETINLVSLMGLIICTGMLVDNAVVVTENIDRYRRDGLAVERAALAGASEISLALTMATVTTIVVFLPMVIMSPEGMMRFFLTKLSLPVIAAIVASLFVALLFVPLAAAHWLRPAGATRAGSASRAIEALYARTFGALHRLYGATLRLSLAHRGAVLVLVLATIAATWYPMQRVETSFQQGRHQRGGRQISFWFNLPNSYALGEADQWFRRVEQSIEPLRDKLDIKHVQTRFWNNRGMVRVILESTDVSDVTVEQATEALHGVMPSAPGVQMYVNWQRGTGSDASLSVSLYGEDTETLAKLAEEAERRLRTVEGLLSVEPDLESAMEEVRVHISREQALRYGLETQVITGTLATAFRGQRLTRFRKGEKEIEVVVQFPEHERQGIGRLGSLVIPAGGGRRIPLEAVAKVGVTRGYGDVRRRDRKTVLEIKLNTTRESLAELRSRVTAVMNAMELPTGYTWDFGSRMRWEQRDMGNFGFALVMSMLFIYLIMGFLFESFLLPLSVMPSIVLSWIGAWWLLFLTGSKLDMMAAIGLVLLAGVVVNNGIVLVDLVNRLRRRGVDREQAILEAGRLRFRPILMTALTTITGMLPMAFGKANFVGIPYSGLGRAFVGGLLSSTTLTLIVVPLFYTLLDDAGRRLRLIATGRSTPPGPAPVAAPDEV